MKYLITFILWMFFVPVAEATTAPDWVLGKGHPKYNKVDFVIGIGHSEKSTVSANESARAELIKNIRVKVNSVLEDYTSTEESFAESTIKTEAEFLLEGAEVVDGWYDDKKDIYYSLVVIKRKYLSDTLLEMIGVLVTKNDSTLNQADSYFREGDLLKALIYYYDGYVESSKLFPYIQTYNSVILSNNKMVLFRDYTQEFQERIQEIVDNIKLEPVTKQVKDDKANFAVQVTYRGEPIEFPVKFNSVYKHYSDRIHCKKKGCYLKIDVLDIIGKDYTFHLVAGIDTKTLKHHFTYELEPRLFKRLELTKVQFKRQLEPLNEDTIAQDVQREINRKEKIFNKMDREVRRSRYGNIRPDIDLSPLGRSRGSIDFRIRMGF